MGLIGRNPGLPYSARRYVVHLVEAESVFLLRCFWLVEAGDF